MFKSKYTIEIDDKIHVFILSHNSTDVEYMKSRIRAEYHSNQIELIDGFSIFHN